MEIIWGVGLLLGFRHSHALPVVVLKLKNIYYEKDLFNISCTVYLL